MNPSHTTTPRTATPQAGAGGINFARAAGFTMVEMLMTMAIATILLTIAVPSFRYVTNSNRIAGELNGLLGDLQFARAEAIKEGTQRHRLRVEQRHELLQLDGLAGRLDRVYELEQHRLAGAKPIFEHGYLRLLRTMSLPSPSTAMAMPSASPTAP